MPNPRDVKFIGSGPLQFNGDDFAMNPFTNDICFDAADFRNSLITVVGTGTVTIYGSTQEKPVDFTAPSTIDNSYVLITTADYSVANTYYDGSTGIVVSSSTKIVELNTNLLTWIGIERSADTVGVLLTQTNNQ